MYSASVQVKETLSQHYVPRITAESAIFCGYFEMGPVDYPVYITTVDELKKTFGRNILSFYNDWNQVFNFLQYSNGIWIVRTIAKDINLGPIGTNATNANSLSIYSYQDWLEKYDAVQAAPIRIVSKSPGLWGNSLSICIISNYEFNMNVLLGNGRYAKEVFNYVSPTQFGIGIFLNGILVEQFIKEQQLVESLNKESNYIFIKIDKTQLLSNGGIDFIFYDSTLMNLSLGMDAAPAYIDYQDSYSLFESIDAFDVDIIICNEFANDIGINLAELRRDCIAFCGLPTFIGNSISDALVIKQSIKQQDNILVNGINCGSETANVINIIDSYLATMPQSQYCHFTLDIKLQKDSITNKMRLVNIAGDVAGLKAQASKEYPWSTGAGLVRGSIKNFLSTYLVLDVGLKGKYYSKGLNFLENNVVQTQNTYSTSSALYNKINIRSLANHLEKEMRLILLRFAFEENTLYKRQQVGTYLKIYLNDVKSNRGISDAFIEVYPSTNNPNQMNVDIKIKPLYLIEFVLIQFTNVGTNSFTSAIV